MDHVVLVADHSLPFVDDGGVPGFDELLRRRSAVVLGFASRLGTAVKGLVLYSEVARIAEVAALTDQDMDFVYGSNLAHGLSLARQVCSETGAHHVALIASMTPSAHIQRNGEAFFSYPPVAETLHATTDEAARCASSGLRIDSLVLGGNDDGAPFRLRSLASLIEQITLPTGGQVVAAASDELVDAVLSRFLATTGLGA